MNLWMGVPSEKQRLFLKEDHRYVAFGGARGGGKSWAVREKAVLLALRYPGIKIMIVRRTYPELRSNHINQIRAMVPREIARYNSTEKEMRFVNGSMILFRYCEGEKDMERYQGTEVDILFIDEATQLEEEVFNKFKACVRGVNSFPKRIYLTCNPGGRGHAWVKRLFVDRKYKEQENPEDYAFIQSLVTDNKALMDSNPEYIKELEALPGKLKKAWRYGDWDIFEGQFFEEFRDSPEHYGDRRYTHVIRAFDVPKDWKRFRSYDYGYNRPFSCGWWAVDHDGRMYRILELYGCTDTPNEGVKWTTDEQFERIRTIELEHPLLKGCRVEGVADPAIWQADGGVSTAEVASRHQVYFNRGDNRRIPGWMQVHYRLRFDENGLPGMYVFDTCKAFIRTMPLLVYDEHIPEDLDTSQEDHVADEVRYMCMANPITPPRAKEAARKDYDPLDIDWQDEDEYTFFRA